MLRMAARGPGIGLAACGLALAPAPAAGASTVKSPTRPVTQTISFPAFYGVYSPCDDSPVSTSGHGDAVTITDGQRTRAVIADIESGGGYELIVAGTGTFSSLSATYTIRGEAIWVNLKKPAMSFHSPLTATLYVTSSNAPEGFNSTPTALKCGL